MHCTARCCAAFTLYNWNAFRALNKREEIRLEPKGGFEFEPPARCSQNSCSTTAALRNFYELVDSEIASANADGSGRNRPAKPTVIWLIGLSADVGADVDLSCGCGRLRRLRSFLRCRGDPWLIVTPVRRRRHIPGVAFCHLSRSCETHRWPSVGFRSPGRL
jgi:hypothetical protein